MKINFLLPFAGNKPIGGFKIVYEYANRLSLKGHEINLIHPSFTFKENVFNNFKYLLRYYQRKFDKSYMPNWFKLDEKINTLWVRSLDDKHIPDADVLIATAWRTAKCSAGLSESKGRKYYFIQHYETWNGPKEEVNATWKMPFRKIVIAKWLYEIAESMNEKAYYVPNAFDFSEFGMDIKPENRNRFSLMMLYNELEFKGSKYGLEAFKIMKSEFPELKVCLFGVPMKPANLPEWISYYQTPERKLLRKLYNEASVFVSPSLSEGFPLPPAEAMTCGSALACTDIGGHKEYALDGETAVLFEPESSQSAVNAIKKLIDDNEFRIKTAYNGNDFIKQFTWNKAVNEFERVLSQEDKIS